MEAMSAAEFLGGTTMSPEVVKALEASGSSFSGEKWPASKLSALEEMYQRRSPEYEKKSAKQKRASIRQRAKSQK